MGDRLYVTYSHSNLTTGRYGVGAADLTIDKPKCFSDVEFMADAIKQKNIETLGADASIVVTSWQEYD